MKGTFFVIFFTSLLLFSCGSKKTVTVDNDGESTMTATFSEHSLQWCTFQGAVKVSASEEPAVGASVVVRGINNSFYAGALVDENGNFTIDRLEIGEYSVEVKCVGYKNFQTVLNFTEFSNCVAEIKLYEWDIYVEKPVIYLYPTQNMEVNVRLDYEGKLKHTYPKYVENGWNVLAKPDGTLLDENGQEYYALFWEGTPNEQIIPEDGFVVPGNETATFLEEKLALLGLNRREANEFIMYWLPRMEDHPFNFIHFSGPQYCDQAKLIIEPQPETVIRVMMITQPLQSKVSVPLQDLSSLQKERKGFVVVEWGGSVVQNAIKGI